MTRYALVIDLDRCTGCETCVLACRQENGTGTDDWLRVDTIGGNGKDKPVGCYPELRMGYLPTTCMHCGQPPCIGSCQSGALFRREDGIVILDTDRCDGCRECLLACPYSAISFDPKAGVAGKCNLCHHRIEAGEEPFCVVCCESQAICWGDLDDPESDVSRLITSRATFIRNPEAGTSPSLRYCAVRKPLGL